MRTRCIPESVIVVFLTLSCASVCLGQPTNRPPGAARVHDPSTIVKGESEFRLFSTGVGILSRVSTNLMDWVDGPRVFNTFPAWTTNAVPGNRGHLWAPDVIRIGDGYFLYYSVSTWGKRTSAIGLATNTTLDPSDANYGWTDRGIVVRTSESDSHNAIDPSVMLDRDGRLWMAYGSYWSGIKLVELDPKTGLRIATNSPLHSLAWKEAIEAAFLHRQRDHYYLFVNWGQCCRGTNSTYEIRVGRSAVVTGPYLDKSGKDLMSGGGSVFLATKGSRIGPGHAAFVECQGKEYLSYHFYDGQRGGRPTLGMVELKWSKDGWPEPGAALGDAAGKP